MEIVVPLAPAVDEGGDAKAAAAFIDRWGTWDEALHGKVAANIRAQQRYRFRLFEYEAAPSPRT